MLRLNFPFGIICAKGKIMFYGRDDDFDELNALWRKRTASLVTCRGRRRIGKSTLIEEFARRSGARFLKLEGIAPDKGVSNRVQLDAFRSQLVRQTKMSCNAFADWSEAFAELDSCLDGRKTVLLLDEISWMGKFDVGFPGELKIAWDNLFKRHDRLVVFLCGSVSTWISKNILNNTGFVGRASLNMVVRELPLDVCLKFWGRRAHRTSVRDIADILSVTGGVPRYLEEVDPSLTADENIRRMCFSPNAMLRDDFSKIFNIVFGDNAVAKRRILETLAEAPMTLSEICTRLKVERSGNMSGHLEDLEVAGFVSGDPVIVPVTGRLAKQRRYRLRDNYTRFYLKYIMPNVLAIDNGSFRFNSVDALKGWDSMMGLQFENLVLSNLPRLLPMLGMDRVLLKSAAPFRQMPTSRRRGCQIDLLLQSDRKVCVVEIKRKRDIGREIEDEVEAKVDSLSLPRDVSVRTALVYEGALAPSVEADGYFDAIVPFGELLGLTV